MIWFGCEDGALLLHDSFNNTWRVLSSPHKSPIVAIFELPHINQQDISSSSSSSISSLSTLTPSPSPWNGSNMAPVVASFICTIDNKGLVVFWNKDTQSEIGKYRIHQLKNASPSDEYVCSSFC